MRSLRESSSLVSGCPSKSGARGSESGSPPLREALKELQYQGLPRDSRSRLPLEAMAFKRVAVRLSSDIEQELRNLVLSMTRTCEDLDVAAFHSHEVDFHRRIWDLADNKYLKLSLEGPCFRLFVFAVIGRDKNWFRASVRQHQEMLEALCSRDPERAQQGFLDATVRYWTSDYCDLTLSFEETMCLRSVTPR